MTPQAFIAHWQNNDITERAGAQQHFNDLCDLLDQEKPRDAENYCFERGAKTQTGQGWADVWKRGCFAWEYKAPNKDLNAALKQLMNYALALDNPPLLVVSDLRTIEIHTHFTGHPSEVHRIQIEELTKPEIRQKLTWLFTDPKRFKPQRTTYAVTEQAAQKIGELADRLNKRGNAPQDVAHFLIQCVFCMFAEDSKLLPEKLFETVMDKSNPDGSKAQKRLTDLFEAMQGGGDFAMIDIPWFNGGLFKNIQVPVLETVDVISLLDAARMDWSQIEPAILGTLFERGLNPDMRSQLGAHYTDPATIMKIIHPVVEQPLLSEWQPIKAEIAENMAKFEAGGKGSQVALATAQKAFLGFLQRLREYRVLDPACGSGNFLYLALKTLKDLEHRVNIEAEALGLHRELNIETSPANVLGIELNPYAAELARITVWIGEIQWMIAHGYQYRKNPILASLEHIENRDAVLAYRQIDSSSEIYSEPIWPVVDAIIGNPPFLGDKKMRSELGDNYTSALRRQYEGRVPGGADLVTYWFEKSREHIQQDKAKHAGLVTTQSIRAGANRKVLERIVESTNIFNAWSDEPWINAGAAVRVSMVCFGNKTDETQLDGQDVTLIHADLSAGDGLDLTKARQLAQNAGLAFVGSQKGGAFEVCGEVARTWLCSPNPNQMANSKVVRPWANGQDITTRSSDTWIIDFGVNRSQDDSELYELPYAYCKENILNVRIKSREERTGEIWWLHQRPRPELRKAFSSIKRYIATPRVSKHRLFVWLDVSVLPDSRLYAIASDQDVIFGILHSRIHERWSLATASMHGVGNDPTYNAKSCFETFPFPEGLTPAGIPGSHPFGNAITEAAIRLNELRENWLNPPEWVNWEITPAEEKAGYPKRAVAKPGHEDDLKKRTLTNLYNQRPSWLDNAHKELDKAVAAAYGWSDYTSEMTDGEILRRLLKLNLERQIK